METITLTRELINDLKSARGGFTGATLKALGLKPYPPKGWTSRLIGRKIAKERYQKAFDGRRVLKGKTIKKMEKQLLIAQMIPNREYPICSKCGTNEIYAKGGPHMDWCEPCLWESVKDDLASLSIVEPTFVNVINTLNRLTRKSKSSTEL